MLKKIKLILIASFFIGGCQSVTIRPESGVKASTPPTYQETKNFYLFGLIGEHHIDVASICADKNPVQMQSQLTFLNGLAGGFTLGIYAPHSVRVWCE